MKSQLTQDIIEVGRAYREREAAREAGPELLAALVACIAPMELAMKSLDRYPQPVAFDDLFHALCIAKEAIRKAKGVQS